MKVGELCAGYGGISMGLRLAGEDIHISWIAEVDDTLATAIWDGTNIDNLGDITKVDWTRVEPVDLITAGFPCQPFSAAGSQLAEADPRYLWPAVRDAIADLLPPRVLLENVRNLVGMRKGEIWARILDDLTNLDYDVTWLTLGACAVGAAHHRHRVFVLATYSPHTGLSVPRRLDVQECGAPRGSVMVPTTTMIDHKDSRNQTSGRQPGSGHHGGTTLGDFAVIVGALLPSPRASDGVNGGPGQRGSSGDLALPSATQPINFDRFQGAVDRHAAIFGPPPAPTEPNRNGAPRLSAAFAEWLMCIPAGHVTDALPRRDALKAIGNGVCPPQIAAAWRYLTGVDKPNDTSIGFGAMTTSTSADVKEIQDRNAAARGRVIDAGIKALGDDFGLRDPDRIAPELIQAAMMELAAVWREEAAHVTTAKRKGHVSIAKEYTQAAARLAGFAVGLTTRPVSESVSAHYTDADPSSAMQAGMAAAEGSDLAIRVGQLLAVDDVIAALPEGDPVAERLSLPGLVTASPVFTSPTGGWSAPTQDQIMGRELAPPLFDDLQTSEEQNLRDIIGPLGASTVTATIDHPFTNPGVPRLNKVRAVEVIPYAELPYVAAATPPRNHVSHSYVESYEGCSLSAMLRDASRAGHIGASRPSWSMIGGNAFHSAVERIERLAVSGVTFLGPDEALWMEHFDAAVKEQMDALVGTPYTDSATWYISNRGKEGFDWWRVEGAKMLGLYVKHHTSEWRAANQTFLLQDKTPVIELPYTMSIRSLDGERGLTAQGFVDRATLDMSTYSLTVLDYKTGSRDPESTFQLGEYGHALLMAMGIPDEPPDRPILGRYWLARKGIYTDAVPVVTRHPLAELQYRYDNADRGQRARIFSPHVTNLCKSCSVTDYCPTQAGRS